jgi:hypothetical protein
MLVSVYGKSQKQGFGLRKAGALFLSRRPLIIE